MAGKIRTYRDLDIWKMGIELVKDKDEEPIPGSVR
jgi:hypothetical protein